MNTQNSGTGVLSTLLQELLRPPPPSTTEHALIILSRYNRNIEDYNRNIDIYNTNFERIIPLLQNIISAEPTTQSSEHTPIISSILSSLLSPSVRGLSQTDISLNTTNYNYTGQLDEPLLCPITMEPIIENTRVIKITRCGHIFKEAAIMTWFQNHNNCPVCRTNVVA